MESKKVNEVNVSKHTPTPLKITFDGQGINNTDEYTSRIAKFQPEYLHFGPRIVRAVNAHEDLLREVKSMLFYIDTFSEESKKNFRSGGNGEAVERLIAKAEGK